MAAIPLIDILAPKRVPFDDVFVEMGVNYAGATPLMEVRAAPGDQGPPLFSLSNSGGASQGIAITFSPAFPDPETEVPADASLVRIIINETTLEALSYGADPDVPVTFHYDIHLTPAGGKKFVFCRGRFIVTPGVTL